MKKYLVIPMLLCLPLMAHAQGIDDLESQLQDVGGAAYGQSGEPTPLTETIGQIINVLLGLLGIIFLVLLIYAGFLWMTAAGNDEKVTKAKDILTTSIIGLLIILSAYAIAQFVVSKLTEATGAGT